jgi:hypothetical protein
MLPICLIDRGSDRKFADELLLVATRRRPRRRGHGTALNGHAKEGCFDASGK